MLRQSLAESQPSRPELRPAIAEELRHAAFSFALSDSNASWIQGQTEAINSNASIGANAHRSNRCERVNTAARAAFPGSSDIHLTLCVND